MKHTVRRLTKAVLLIATLGDCGTSVASQDQGSGVFRECPIPG